MGKQRSSLRQVPWQSWEHWNWVATELFSDSPEHISGALDRVAAWQSRGNTPIAVETSAAIIGIHQRDPQISRGISQELALPEEMLRMMYSMAIQRLVNGVVDQSQKRNTTSVADRAEFAGLPRLLVDVRHEAAHTELPGLALLRVASKQALGWLKSQYWDQQRETLANARLALKAKLVEHCLLVVEILNPRCGAPDPQQSEDEQDPDSKSENLLEGDRQETLRVKKQQRSGLLNDLLDLSLSSMPNLISILVDDRLLEKDTLRTEGEALSKQEVITGSTDCGNLTSVTDSAWKFTLRELCSHLPRLSEMLIVAIINHLNKSSPRSVTVHLPEDAGPSIFQASDINIDEVTDLAPIDSKKRKRLISWCAWLLGKRYVQDSEGPSEKEPQQLKLLKISNSLFVKTDLTTELLGELLRLCLSTSNGREPLAELVSLIAGRLGNERFQHRVAALAHLGTSLQRAHRDIIDTSEDQEATVMTAGEERPREGSSEKATAASPAAGDCWNVGSETIKSALEVARSQQSAFFARFSLKREDTSTSETINHNEPGADGPVKLPNTASSRSTRKESNHQNSLVWTNVGRRKEGSGVQSWTVVEDWRSCAIGMIPSPCHSVGVLPSLDLHRRVGETEKVLCKPVSVSCEETAPATETARKPLDHDNLAAAGSREDLAPGKRTTDDHLEESMKGKKLKKTDRHVHFVDEGVANVSGDAPRGPRVSNQAVSNEKEQRQTGSLLQGCLLQQGMYMPMSSQQLESLKSSIHVL